MDSMVEFGVDFVKPKYGDSFPVVALTSFSFYIVFGSLVSAAIPFVDLRWIYSEKFWKREKRIDGISNGTPSNQVMSEFKQSLVMVLVNAVLTVFPHYWIYQGRSRIYRNIDDYGWPYFIFSIFAFLIFSDFLIYWIHRILHWPFFL